MKQNFEVFIENTEEKGNANLGSGVKNQEVLKKHLAVATGCFI